METFAQKSIRHCMDMLASFRASEEELKEGQFQFYQFIVSIYEKMYESPEEYLVSSAAYEEYLVKLEDKLRQRAKEKEHVNDARESTLRNAVQQAIQFYAVYFYHLGIEAAGIDPKSGSLIVSKEGYRRVREKMERIHEAKYNPERYLLLKKSGVQTTETPEAIYIRHTGYPQLMLGLEYLCKAPESRYKFMNYLRLDYKNAYLSAPLVKDILETFPEQSVEIVRELEENLRGISVKTRIRPLRGIVSDFKWKVEYSCKGKNICGFYADNAYFMLCIYFNDFQNINRLAQILYEEDPDLFQWYKRQFPQRLCKCRNNRWVRFGEEKRRICGMSNRTETINPEKKDVENAIRVFRMYRKMGETE